MTCSVQYGSVKCMVETLKIKFVNIYLILLIILSYISVIAPRTIAVLKVTATFRANKMECHVSDMTRSLYLMFSK